MSLEGLSNVASIGSSIAGITRTVAPAIQGVGGVVGSVTAGIEGQRIAEYNSRIAELESALTLQSAARSEQNAAIARTAASIEAGRVLRAGRRLQGEQAAEAAKSGVDVTQGSPLLAQLETIRLSHEDAVLARYKGDVAATGLLTEASQQRIQAQALLSRAALLRAQGRRQLLTGGIGAASAIGKAAGTYEELARLSPKGQTGINYGSGIFASNLRASEYAGYGYD